MKVLRIVPFLDFGGVEQRIYLTAQRFEKVYKGSLITVVLNKKGRITEQMKSEGYQVICLNSKVRIPNLFLISKLFNLFKLHSPDVIHTSGAEANFHGLIAAWLAGVPIRIGEEIGFPNHDWKWKFIFKRVYATATKVIAISEGVKNRIVELGEVKAEKVEVVYNPVSIKEEVKIKKVNGIDVTFYSNNSFVFVTTCRLVPVKNLNTLITVFQKLVLTEQGKELKLWIIGEGPERAKLERVVGDFALDDKVVFWGFQENVKPFLDAADAFVLPSLSEGFSISLVEAMLCGLPCIVTNQGGPAEIVEHGKTGFLIDPLNANGLQISMRNLFRLTPESRKSIGQMAKNEAKRFSVENYIDSLMSVYGLSDSNLPAVAGPKPSEL